jgi:hypothetical protein
VTLAALLSVAPVAACACTASVAAVAEQSTGGG